MFIIVGQDDFNRSDTTSIGAQWNERSGGWEIVSNKLKLTSHSAIDDICSWETAIGASPAADYVVETVAQFTGGGGGGVGPMGRYADNSNFYFIESNPTYNVHDFLKKVAGSYTNIGSYSVTVDENVDYKGTLVMAGTSLKMYIDGVLRASATDSSLSAAGKAGCRGFSTSNGQIFDSFVTYAFSPLRGINVNQTVKRAGFF